LKETNSLLRKGNIKIRETRRGLRHPVSMKETQRESPEETLARARGEMAGLSVRDLDKTLLIKARKGVREEEADLAPDPLTEVAIREIVIVMTARIKIGVNNNPIVRQTPSLDTGLPLNSSFLLKTIYRFIKLMFLREPWHHNIKSFL
jgi:hypothetical protein